MQLRVKVSEQNSKIGKIPNLSLPPGVTCSAKIPCFNEGCYAKNAYERWSNVKNAWDMNLEYYLTDPVMFFEEFQLYLKDRRPRRFRLFVGGDFPNERFYRLMNSLALGFIHTSFLVFTKRYNYDYSFKAPNLKVILSCWPGVPLPENTFLPRAWLMEDERRPKDNYYVCPGCCDECNHACWEWIDREVPVVFNKH